MMAVLQRFLWLWLPSVLIFLAGLRRAWLTGQADPWDWGIATALVLAGAGLLLARQGRVMQGWAAWGGVVMALIFCTLAAGRMPDLAAMISLSTVALLAIFGGALLRWPSSPSSAIKKQTTHPARFSTRLKRTATGAVFLMLAALIVWRGPAQPLQPVQDRPELAVITGLPLFWAQGGPKDAPIITILRTRFIVTPVDDPLKLPASGARRLLLAQPRALAPAQLVAIDRWVRNGGTALVLADPLLRWPSDLPLGDRRRPLSVSLLPPLLHHWGFRPAALEAEETRYFSPDGSLVTLSGVQAYLTGDGGPDDKFVHRKRIGRGEVVLLGDADPIDDRLWLADPARPLDPRLWVADTPARIAFWLGASIPSDRHWMKDAAVVAKALRWALLAGTLWAAMGAILLCSTHQQNILRTKKEHMAQRGRKTA